MLKVRKTGTCWLWTAGDNGHGYGVFQTDKKRCSAHRWLYEYLNGPVDKNLDLDHLCRVRNCVNPAHLEPVTRSENSLRGIGPKLAAERQLRKTHCPLGHEYNEENTYYSKNTVGRRCNPCHAIKEKIRRDRKQQTKDNKDVI